MPAGVPGDSPTASVGRRPAADVARRRVLVIEDNADAADSLRELLLLWGHDVAVAHEGAEGVETARAYLPDVVLCDIGLPRMDGYEVARALRADPGTAAAFLIAVTGYATADDRLRATRAGFDTHLGKPLDPEEIAYLLAAARPRPH